MDVAERVRIVLGSEGVLTVLASFLSRIDCKRLAATTPPALGCMNAYGGEGPGVTVVDDLMNHALVAGLSTSAGQKFVTSIVERVLDDLRAVPACGWAAARKRVLMDWHPDKHEGDLRKKLAQEVFKAVKPVMDAQAVSSQASLSPPPSPPPPPPPPPPFTPSPPRPSTPAPSPSFPQPARVVEEKVWELCMGGGGVWLKAGGWGVCKGCYKTGHVGRSFEC